MLKMSFFDGTLDRNKAREFVNITDKKLVYTYGFEYRNPTTHRVPIDKERALELISHESYLDITEEEDFIHFNAFSSNDMF